MQIFRDMSRPLQQRQADGDLRLKRSEMVSDLFNNQSDAKDAGDVKLRLSHAARRLNEALRGRVEKFLKQHKDLGEDLDRIELPEGARGAPGQVAVRKMSMYLQWEKIQQGGVEGSEGAEQQVFQAIRSHGRDEEMRELFNQYDEERQQVQKERQRAAPNYYYMAFPETYAFN